METPDFEHGTRVYFKQFGAKRVKFTKQINTLRSFSGKQSLWIVGSSSVYLGITHVNISWIGKRGLTLEHLNSTIDTQFKKEPNVLFIYLGSNVLITEGLSGKGQ